MLQKMVREENELTTKSKVDFSRLPSCKAALMPHADRVNHRVGIYKRAKDAIQEKKNPVHLLKDKAG